MDILLPTFCVGTIIWNFYCSVGLLLPLMLPLLHFLLTWCVLLHMILIVPLRLSWGILISGLLRSLAVCHMCHVNWHYFIFITKEVLNYWYTYLSDPIYVLIFSCPIHLHIPNAKKCAWIPYWLTHSRYWLNFGCQVSSYPWDI